MSSEKTRLYYDGIAKGYAELYHEEQREKIESVSEYFPVSGKGLDIGAGDGVLNTFLNPAVDLTSFDLSDELLKLNPNTTKMQGSWEAMPFSEGQFDVLFSFSVLQDVDNVERAVEEANRVLRMHGVFFLSFVKISTKKQRIISILERLFSFEYEVELEKDLVFILKKV